MWQLLSLSPPLLITWESNRIVPQCLEYSSNFLWQSGSHYGISASKTIWKEKLCKGGWKGKQWTWKRWDGNGVRKYVVGIYFCIEQIRGLQCHFCWKPPLKNLETHSSAPVVRSLLNIIIHICHICCHVKYLRLDSFLGGIICSSLDFSHWQV